MAGYTIRRQDAGAPGKSIFHNKKPLPVNGEGCRMCFGCCGYGYGLVMTRKNICALFRVGVT